MISLFPDTKIFIQIGPFTVTWYALLIMTGAVIAYEISKYNMKKAGYKSEDVDDIFMGVLVFGFIGARLWYVLFSDLSYYISNPMSILAVWEGGLAIQGGLIGGALFAYNYMKKKRINFLQAIDLILPNVLLAQALGRWGNFVNQEAYGEVVSEAFINKFPTFIKEMMYIDGAYHHPTFLYESVANVIGFILIVFVLKRINRVRRGDLAYAYLMWYGVTRFFIEGLRTDSLHFLGLRMAQIISIIFVIVGVFGTLGIFRKLFPSPKPVVLFDFDGTLASTEQIIFKSFKGLFAQKKPNREMTDDEILKLNGLPLDDVIREYFPGNVNEAIAIYRSVQRPLLETDLVAKYGAVELVKNLKTQGYQLGVVSNRSNPSLSKAIEIIGLKDMFEVVISLDMMERPKPDPNGIDMALELLGRDKGGVIYIGDTKLDIECGRRAGSFTVGCIFDTIREHEIKVSKPNRIIRDFAEIESILEEDIEWTTTMM